MTTSRCDFLDHTRLRDSPALRTLAVDKLFEIALEGSARFRLEFNAHRLLPILGPACTAALLPGQAASARGPLERRDESLDHDRARLLRKVMSFGPGEWPDPPINYINRVILFDRQGKIILRASDSAEFILFALPPERRDALVEGYRAAGIPANIIEPVDVDINAAVQPLCLRLHIAARARPTRETVNSYSRRPAWIRSAAEGETLAVT